MKPGRFLRNHWGEAVPTVLQEREVEEAWAYNLTPRLRREIRKIVFDHFDQIVEEWNRHLGDADDADN